MSHFNSSNIIRPSGFSLIEVLVSLLILAVGILGIIALQFKGLKYSYDANVRSQVTFLANDIIDKMRLNNANALNYVSTYNAGDGHTPCNYASAAVAAVDLDCWHDFVDWALPPGSDADILAPVGGLYTVALGWTDREGELHTVTYSFAPNTTGLPPGL
jgi:type IV pilus assembly protein PilV